MSQTPSKAATKGRIRHSIVPWCFELFGEKWSFEKVCEVARELGCESVELVTADRYPILRQHGLKCAIGAVDLSPDLPFMLGFNNPVHWPRVLKATEEAIEAAAAFGTTRVIAFTGYSAHERGEFSREEGARNCIEGFKKILPLAEARGVTLCLEMLNTRDDTTPRHGHPGYQGNDLEYCIDVIKQTGSEHLKVLFDIYHVQIMHGDLIRRIRQHIDYIGHVHTAGVPGRGELDDRQEIHYPGVMHALVEAGYDGFVGHEFIPTRDPLAGLYEAISWCDV